MNIQKIQSKMRYHKGTSGNGGGYMTIPEHEELDTPHESDATVLTTRTSTMANGEKWLDSGLEDVAPPDAFYRKRKELLLFLSLGAFSLVVVGMGIRVVLLSQSNEEPQIGEKVIQTGKRLGQFDEMGRYVLEDYDAKPAFSDFLPGVAGLYGKPLWSFFVNRGQAITSFGVLSKDFPILEYNPANKAYQSTSFLGFRTFLMGSRKEQKFLIEPFSAANANFEQAPDQCASRPKRYLYVGSNEVQIQEIDSTHMLETNVSYFILPEESFGALVRRTTITNLDKTSPITFSALDGLAWMEPVGGPLNNYLKNMGRTLEGWFNVYWADATNVSMPFYRMSTEPRDGAAIKIEEAGHYCLSSIDGTIPRLLPIVFDTAQVFGEDTTLMRPAGLYKHSIKDILSGKQYGMAKTSSAFAALDEVTLSPGASVTITSLYGQTDFITDVPLVARKILQIGYIQYKLTRAREIVNQLTAAVDTNTANHLFNGHVKQMFMDNSLRGGIPMILGDIDDTSNMRNADEDPRLKVFHVFSRVHGDLERDYNNFVLDSTYFSQGPGNYRDVLQNRRNDVVFNPRIGSFNVKTFLSYIQADGYNPLTVEAPVFVINDLQQCDRLATMAVGTAVGHRAQRDALDEILCNGPFRPGQLFLLLEEQNIELLMDRQRFIEEVVSVSESHPMAVFSDGFWADHWTYYLDLIDSYLSVYPEGEESLMFDVTLRYFFSAASVKPRSDKYVLSYTIDGRSRHVRQLNATMPDEEKFTLQMTDVQSSTGWYGIDANWQNDSNGFAFRSTPIAKLMLLAVIKYATRDSYGMGIEYEAGKPGWNDAMNGLPGMVGSGMPETYELKRLLTYIISLMSKHQRTVVIPEELGILMDDIEMAQKNLDSSGYEDGDALGMDVPKELFNYWDAVATARESYRANVRLHFNGATRSLSARQVSDTCERWLVEIELGIARAQLIGTDGHEGTSNVTPTYFSFDVTAWKPNGKHSYDGLPLVNATAMRVGIFALFLEGPIRMMRTVPSEETLNIYSSVRNSGLRDEQLKMYTISASLAGQSIDMGRMMAFSPGWLENQSVWLHMSYKYYLELLRSKLYDQFYEEMTSGGMLPFMNATVYGRSLLECSSFIASSAFADPSVRGRGFLARLSGSTAEFLSMWIIMFIGPKPFFLDENNELSMQLAPALPFWLFQGSDAAEDNDTEPKLSFRLFGSIHVTYHNPERKDLFNVKPKNYLVTYKDGSTFSISSSIIPGDIARKIRGQLLIDGIDAFF